MGRGVGGGARGVGGGGLVVNLINLKAHRETKGISRLMLEPPFFSSFFFLVFM